MPVTAVGKIFKPTLRCDAARRALEAVLAPLRSSSVAIRVEAGPHERFGITAHVTLFAADPGAAQSVSEQIGEILWRFTIHR